MLRVVARTLNGSIPVFTGSNRGKPRSEWPTRPRSVLGSPKCEAGELSTRLGTNSVIINRKKMAPSYKLTYYPSKALGEPVRFLFAYGGIEYEDFRFDRPDWPSKFKPNMPFEQVPVLEFDGNMYHQSLAIGRYLAKKVGLYGSDDVADMKVDGLLDTFVDFRLKIDSYYYDDDENSKDLKKKPLYDNSVPFFMSRFDDIVKKNNGYFVNGKVSWADLYFVAVVDYWNAMLEMDVMESRPNLCKMREKVLGIPNIKAWVAKRPVTEL